MRYALLLCASLAASHAAAGVEDALTHDILPGFAGFTAASTALAEAAGADCTAPALRAPWNAAFDAWTRIGDVRLGPSETGALSVVFWPDARGFTPKTLSRMISGEEPAGRDLEAFAHVSIAARGLFALEQMLYDDAFAGYESGSYGCALVQTMTADLAAQAGALESGWRDGFAQVILSAGEAGNATYLSPEEALRAVYTQVLSSLEFTADTRLGRPLGTFERPRPTRAEAWRSGRSLRNVLLDAAAAKDLAVALADWEMPATEAAMDRLEQVAARVTDPAFQDVEDPAARLRVEIVQQHVRALHDAIEQELGLPLGLTPGFNSQDGD
ncbi:imelysin family protein [Salipiger sp. P9]|uniref:imelysin family protein n=1 Tax=Salipiger pentaromativorans TaxID=2943193 RepID=UPI0021578280|nr:imelysin family protein [Salipiger pentaromativorans]MCR8550160.1 imelysin family protein [Salipiger pentaromativorans]